MWAHDRIFEHDHPGMWAHSDSSSQEAAVTQDIASEILPVLGAVVEPHRDSDSGLPGQQAPCDALIRQTGVCREDQRDGRHWCCPDVSGEGPHSLYHVVAGSHGGAGPRIAAPLDDSTDLGGGASYNNQ